MRILLLADRMESGGAETHIETLARGLLKRGHTVGLFSCGGRIAEDLAHEGVICRKFAFIGRNPVAFLGAKGALAEEVCKNGYEILHAHTRMTAFLARQICTPYMQKTPKKPALVVTAHAKFRPDGLFRLLSVWGEETIAVSEDLRAHLADCYHLPAERVRVIPNGIDGERFFPCRGLGEKGAAAGKPAEILFVSRLEPDCSRGAELLCCAARLLAAEPGMPPFVVTIAGRGSAFATVSCLAGRSNLLAGRPILRVVRPGGEEDLVKLYRRADLFAGVSRAAMEASFCGCPVLLCGNEGYGGLLSPDRPELAAGNFTCRGFAEPTAELLAGDLAKLLKNRARLHANAGKTSAWMRKNFSAERMVAATEAVYRRLLWRRGKGDYPI